MDSFSFLPWVRQRLAVASTDGATRRTLPITVTLAVEGGGPPTAEATLPAQLYGPGDVVGLNPAAVLKTLPPAGEQRYSPGLLAGLELAEEDLPWRYSPDVAGSNDRLTPWCCLIVLREDEYTRLEQGAAPLPLVRITHPDVVFPNPQAATNAVPLWPWAHVQANDTLTATDVNAFLTQDLVQNPDRALARLLCSRRLEENTGYLACLVPVFEAGRLAGLGQPPGATAHQVAWLSDATPSVPLTTPLDYPVYYQWEFRTGPAGDFESLARQLRPDAAPDTGAAAVDVVTPLGSLDPSRTERRQTVTLPSAVHPIVATTPANARIAASLYAELAPAVAPPGRETGAAYRRPVLTPPLYGQSYSTAPATLADPATTPPAHWREQVNLDVRYRALAGLGAQYVADNQEELMQRAWQQVRDVLVANAHLRGMQAGLQTTDAARRTHLPVEESLDTAGRATGGGSQDPPVLTHTLANYGVQLTALALPRLRAAPGGLTLAETVRRSDFPQAVLTPTFRRLTKPFGRYQAAQAGRPLRPTQPAGPVPTTLTEPGTSLAQRDTLFDRILDGSVTGAPPKPALALLYQLDDAAADQVLAASTTPTHLATPGGILAAGGEFWANYLQAYTDFRQPLALTPVPVVKPALNMPALKARLLAGTDPGPVFLARANRALRFTPQYGSFAELGGGQLRLGGGGGNEPVLRAEPVLTRVQPVMAYPVFKEALGEALRRQRPDLFLPGLADMGDNTVRLYEPNAAFVEAFLLGANHAMGTELLWRGFPTDLRGTYFQQFWDSSEYQSLQPTTTDPVIAERNTRDITPIHTWSLTSALGTHPGSTRVMLAVRGELLRRYPTAIVRAQAAQVGGAGTDPADPTTWVPDPTSVVYPTARLNVGQDVVLFEFPLASAAAIGDRTASNKGYFFVFMERPGEMQFGLDLGGNDLPPISWQGLSWAYAQPTPGHHLGIDPNNSPSITGSGPFQSIHTSAELAYALFQRPFAVAIHARELLS